jgi:pSer/pThr/pTyr-binding forkhead associated (FHA) protein
MNTTDKAMTETLILEALTPEAEKSLGGPDIVLSALPFRVGRECRMVAGSDGALRVQERRKAGSQPNNDLYLLDPGPRLQVSRAHFQIEVDGNGGFLLVDRGSALGTLIGNQRVGGGDAGGTAPIKDGDLLVVGTSESPFLFRFRIGV